MSENTLLACVAVLISMVAVWFFVLGWLFHRLANQHATAYRTIGSPTLFWNNSPRNNWLLLRFLFSARHRQLSDKALTNVTRFARAFLIIYLCAFFGLVALIVTCGIK